MKSVFLSEMKGAHQFLRLFISNFPILSSSSSSKNAVSEYKADQYSAWNMAGVEYTVCFRTLTRDYRFIFCSISWQLQHSNFVSVKA